MNEAGDSILTLNLILYVLLPIWTIAAFFDWCCHRATRIESTSGLRESLIHAIMGIQVGAAMMVCLLFEVNVLVMLVCLFVLVTHEIVAHHDIVWASSRREIKHWETHIHSYLSSVPFYLFSLIVVRRWGTFLEMVRLDWAGQMKLVPRPEPLGGSHYLPAYLTLALCVGVLPYGEEMLRCWLHQRRVSRGKA